MQPCCDVHGCAQVIGGICYRPYYEQKFAEIAFCAIKSEEQVTTPHTEALALSPLPT